MDQQAQISEYMHLCPGILRVQHSLGMRVRASDRQPIAPAGAVVLGMQQEWARMVHHTETQPPNFLSSRE